MTRNFESNDSFFILETFLGEDIVSSEHWIGYFSRYSVADLTYDFLELVSVLRFEFWFDGHGEDDDKVDVAEGR